jgi:hypothetical protein
VVAPLGAHDLGARSSLGHETCHVQKCSCSGPLEPPDTTAPHLTAFWVRQSRTLALHCACDIVTAATNASYPDPNAHVPNQTERRTMQGTCHVVLAPSRVAGSGKAPSPPHAQNRETRKTNNPPPLGAPPPPPPCPASGKLLAWCSRCALLGTVGSGCAPLSAAPCPRPSGWC